MRMKPDDEKLNRLLEQAQIPDRSSGYWEFFPRRVTANLTDGHPPVRHFQRRWAIRFVAACVVLTVAIRIGRKSPDTKPVSYAKLYQQIEALFPNQVQA